MSYIKILKNTVCDGKYVKTGDIVEASHKDACYLVASGAAEKSAPKPKAKAKKKPVNKMIDTSDLETRDASE